MDFCEELKANGIDPDKFIAHQNEFIIYYRRHQESNRKVISYREYLEKDQLITMIEKFINKLERERLHEKIHEISNPSS